MFTCTKSTGDDGEAAATLETISTVTAVVASIRQTVTTHALVRALLPSRARSGDGPILEQTTLRPIVGDPE